ncbi:hypothetical protein, partial [Enterococcus faecalis]|uniref:hypothetical protein n=1 Tax=Enterococcus faecalis TaxID=1351 RepID=UPI0030C7DAE3
VPFLDHCAFLCCSRLKVSEIKADNRKSKTYRNLLDNEKFDDATDVILSTRLLADGINIQNTKDYVLMIAPNHYKQAKFYNLDLIRQASNRFRNQYEKIMILLYVNQDVYQDDSNPRASQQPYNLEYQYNNLLRTAKIIQAQSESTLKDNLTHFTPSIAEKLAGLFKPKRA